MRNLQILMPMGGLGSRFSEAEYTTPKPIIPVDGVPMFKKALSSINEIDVPKTYLFVIRQENVDKDKLDEQILDAEPTAKVIVIPEPTKGASETAYKAKDLLMDDDGLIVMDCDLWFSSKGYVDAVLDSLSGKSDIDGALLTFKSDKPRYSYALTDGNNIVNKTAEKKVISNRAITGAYYFSEAKKFKNACEELFKLPLNESFKEYYISSLYNIMISKGYKIIAVNVDEYESFGTPEELNDYIRRLS